MDQNFGHANIHTGGSGAGRGGDIASHNITTINASAFYYQQREAYDQRVTITKDLFRSEMIGYKGNETLPFDDAADITDHPDSSNIAGISKIRIQHGRMVNYLEITYKLTSGETCIKKHGEVFNYPFGFGFRWETVALSDSECLTEVSGRQSDYIHEITFEILDTVSHKVRNVGPYGNCQAVWWIPVIYPGRNFRCRGTVVAFAGSCYNYHYIGRDILAGLSFICTGSAPTVTA